MSDRQRKSAWRDRWEQALVDALSAQLGPSSDAKAPASLHGYFAPARGTDGHRVLSSCSGSPFAEGGRRVCLEICDWINESPGRAAMRERIDGIDGMLIETVTRLVGAPPGTTAVLAASPADAFRLMGGLFSIEAKGKPLRLPVPTIAENGQRRARGHGSAASRAGTYPGSIRGGIADRGDPDPDAQAGW
jgi:hypothetical protein